MAATLSLDTITSSGSTITVPTGKTLAVTTAGNLTIGGVAITTGAQGVLSKTGTYTILPGDFTGKSSLVVFVDVSAGTSTETIITLPAEANFSTCAIHVVSTAAHGAGNKITIKNDTPTEVYTLYGKGDHCEFVSDGTTAFRTGNEWVTVTGGVYLSTDGQPAMAASTLVRVFNTYSTVDYNIGSWWDHSTNFRIDIGFDCDIEVVLNYVSQSNNGMQPVLKHLNAAAAVQQYYNYAYSGTIGGYYAGQESSTFLVRNISATDYLETWNYNVVGSTQYFTTGPGASIAGSGARFDFRVLRRH
jgi:hypothetical protein